MGAAWREKYSSEPGGAVLPSVADFQGARAMDWPFILKNYRQFLNENPQISLIPSNFRFQRESSQAEAAHHAWQRIEPCLPRHVRGVGGAPSLEQLCFPRIT